MQPMELLTDDGSFTGKGMIGGEAGVRRGRFLCESEPRSSRCLAGPLAIRFDGNLVRVKPTSHRLGGFWGLELSFEELCESD